MEDSDTPEGGAGKDEGWTPSPSFSDEGPGLQASALGWKRVLGVFLLAAVGVVVANRLGWVGGGDRSGIPFDGAALDSSRAPSEEPAIRERGSDSVKARGTPASAGDPAEAARPGETSAAAAEDAGEATPEAEPVPETQSPESAAPPPPERAEEEGPLSIGEFVLVRPGTFQMGYADAAADQKPVHAVILSGAFYLQRSEVTQGEWRAVMGTNPSRFSSCGNDCPVEQVSWHDVQAFIKALNARYPGRRYRLPTEAEWEYAARAGTRSGGEDAGPLEDVAWFDGNAGARTRPVKGKLANPWGLHDMQGNVAEWVGDWYRADYYRTGPGVDPPGPKDGAARVVRGGSWGSPRRFVGTLGRMDRDPFTRDFTIGFRLARDP